MIFSHLLTTSAKLATIYLIHSANAHLPKVHGLGKFTGRLGILAGSNVALSSPVSLQVHPYISMLSTIELLGRTNPQSFLVKLYQT